MTKKELKEEIHDRMWALAWDCAYWKDKPTKKDVTERINKTLKLIDDYMKKSA